MSDQEAATAPGMRRAMKVLIITAVLLVLVMAVLLLASLHLDRNIDSDNAFNDIVGRRPTNVQTEGGLRLTTGPRARRHTRRAGRKTKRLYPH